MGKKKAEDENDNGLDQYFTDQKLAKRVVEWAELSRGMRVLEPSAGDGGLLRFMPRNVRIDAVEIDPEQCEKLRKFHSGMGVTIHGPMDFLKWEGFRDQFDVAIMNPPYGEGRDGLHVAHALKFANRVIAIVRVNFEFGTGRFAALHRWAETTRRAILVRRGKFYGPADKGHTARHDYQVIELVRRNSDRLEDSEPDRVETEYWTDSW